MKRHLRIIARRGREKPLTVCPTEIEDPTVSKTCLWEINQKSQHPKPWIKTSIHNLAHDAIVLLIFPTIQRLCPTLAIGAFGQESVASSLFDCGISALEDRRRLNPISSIKASCNSVFVSLPHENEMCGDFTCGCAKCMR
jgi:hypothetical protein